MAGGCCFWTLRFLQRSLSVFFFSSSARRRIVSPFEIFYDRAIRFVFHFLDYFSSFLLPPGHLFLEIMICNSGNLIVSVGNKSKDIATPARIERGRDRNFKRPLRALAGCANQSYSCEVVSAEDSSDFFNHILYFLLISFRISSQKSVAIHYCP